MKRPARFLLLLWLAMASVACASSSSSTSGRTIMVGPADSGSTITLKTSDRLIVELGSSSEAIARQWRLVAYPQSALRLTRAIVDAGRFEFEAIGAGQGQLVLAGQARCDPGQTGAYGGGYGPQCPVAGAASLGIPAIRFAITVQVS